MSSTRMLDLEISIDEAVRTFQEGVDDTMRRRPDLSRDKATDVALNELAVGVLGCLGSVMILCMVLAIGGALGVRFLHGFLEWRNIWYGVIGVGLVIVACLISKKTR